MKILSPARNCRKDYPKKLTPFCSNIISKIAKEPFAKEFIFFMVDKMPFIRNQRGLTCGFGQWQTVNLWLQWVSDRLYNWSWPITHKILKYLFSKNFLLFSEKKILWRLSNKTSSRILNPWNSYQSRRLDWIGPDANQRIFSKKWNGSDADQEV